MRGENLGTHSISIGIATINCPYWPDFAVTANVCIEKAVTKEINLRIES